MRNPVFSLTMTAVALMFATTQTALARKLDARTAIEESYVEAAICQKASGSAWNSVKADAWAHLTNHLGDVGLDKHEQDEILRGLMDKIRATPITDQVRRECQRKMASGS